MDGLSTLVVECLLPIPWVCGAALGTSGSDDMKQMQVLPSVYSWQ